MRLETSMWVRVGAGVPVLSLHDGFAHQRENRPKIVRLGPSQGGPWGEGGRGRTGFVMRTEINVHGGALCFMVMEPSLLGGWGMMVGSSWQWGPL